MHDDRRTEIRKKMMTFAPVREHGHGTLLGYLGNLTMNGAMVIGEKPLDVEAVLTLEIDFPAELPGIDSPQLVVPARVARCTRDMESDHEFMIGFEFGAIDSSQAHMIQTVLDRFHFRHRSWAKK